MQKQIEKCIDFCGDYAILEKIIWDILNKLRDISRPKHPKFIQCNSKQNLKISIRFIEHETFYFIYERKISSTSDKCYSYEKRVYTLHKEYKYWIYIREIFIGKYKRLFFVYFCNMFYIKTNFLNITKLNSVWRIERVNINNPHNFDYEKL